MAGRGGSLALVWTDRPTRLADAVDEYARNVADAVFDLVEMFQADLVSAAQEDASWTDRTANARQGLSSAVTRSGDTIELVLFHLMEYGIWLEVAHDGTYAIIMPTIDRMAPVLLAQVDQLLA